MTRAGLTALLTSLALLGGSGPPAVASAETPLAPVVVPAGAWAWPLAGTPTVTRGFDVSAGPYGAGHRGVDLAASPGDAVLAAGAGVIAFAGSVAGRPVVSIDHADGLRTTYEPVRPGVGAGQTVAAGEPVGVLEGGHAGCPVAACLHWGLRRGAVYLDPLSLLTPPEVRLLPWD